MARARNIKPGLFRNEILGQADPLFTLLFEGLWVLSDRDGKLEDRPVRIKGDVFPYRNVDVEPMLEWLQDNGFILRYTVKGKRYILVIEFKKHQNPHKNETPSEIPDPCSEEIGTTTEIIGTTRADSLIPDSLSTDSLIPEVDAAPAQALKLPPPAFLGEKNEAEIQLRARVLIGDGWELPEKWGRDAEALGYTPEVILRESEKYRQYYVAGKGAGTRRSVKGWRQAWSNWLANTEKFQRRAA